MPLDLVRLERSVIAGMEQAVDHVIAPLAAAAAAILEDLAQFLKDAVDQDRVLDGKRGVGLVGERLETFPVRLVATTTAPA
ncbi:hypothetical protein [Streptomyces sp. NPDC101455]|uniref:hypothetical protein n=1 Tax=Streptomyces sp. NPDC101455 TaxID=3366142 RepID=UPI00382C4B90